MNELNRADKAIEIIEGIKEEHRQEIQELTSKELTTDSIEKLEYLTNNLKDSIQVEIVREIHNQIQEDNYKLAEAITREGYGKGLIPQYKFKELNDTFFRN